MIRRAAYPGSGRELATAVRFCRLGKRATEVRGKSVAGIAMMVVLANAMFVVASMPVATPYQFWVKRRIAAATPMHEARGQT